MTRTVSVTIHARLRIPEGVPTVHLLLDKNLSIPLLIVDGGGFTNRLDPSVMTVQHTITEGDVTLIDVAHDIVNRQKEKT